MSSPSAPNVTGFVPVLRYRDVGAAAEWLCRAFGFERHHVVNGDGGSIIYAQLKCGSGLIMLVPLGESDLDRLMCQPAEAGGYETQVCYIVVPDAAQHCVTAAEAGARIVLALASDDRGGAGYTCRDLEGHVWSFGTYDPADAVKPFIPVALADEEAAPPSRRRSEAGAPAHRSGSAFAAMAAAVVLAVIAGGAGLIAAFNGALTTITSQNSQSSEERLDVADDRLAAALEATNRASESARAAEEKLAAERKARETAEATAAAATAAAQAERDKTEALRLSLETDAQRTLDQLTQARTQRAATELDRSRLEHQLEVERREHAAHVAQMEALTERLAQAEKASTVAPSPAKAEAALPNATAPVEETPNPGQASAPSHSSAAAAMPSSGGTAEATAGRDVTPNETGSIEDEKAKQEAAQDKASAVSVTDPGDDATKAATRQTVSKPSQKARPQKTARAANAGAKKSADKSPPLVLEPASKQWPYNSW